MALPSNAMDDTAASSWLNELSGSDPALSASTTSQMLQPIIAATNKIMPMFM